MDPADIAALLGTGIALIAAGIAFGNAKSAHRNADAATSQAHTAKSQAASAEEQAKWAKAQVEIMLADRADRSDQQQRQAAVEVLRAGRKWRNALDGLIMYMGAVSDMEALASSDTSNTYTEASTAYQAALLDARFAVHDPGLSDVVGDLQVLTEKVTERTGRIHAAPRDARGHAPIEDILSAMEIPRDAGILLEKLDELTMRRFAPGRWSEVAPSTSDAAATGGTAAE
ncbi:hypothetical protein [Lentzea sp. NBRC 105346]|uniref:hypothetical protein n=1 Tax=Lentzea sp. NBRC 105346 TaxID=3032205 RepID=UPI0025564142|nr:hypothetical protein [Lentzea sp. NBRC 105346]